MIVKQQEKDWRSIYVTIKWLLGGKDTGLISATAPVLFARVFRLWFILQNHHKFLDSEMCSKKRFMPLKLHRKIVVFNFYHKICKLDEKFIRTKKYFWRSYIWKYFSFFIFEIFFKRPVFTDSWTPMTVLKRLASYWIQSFNCCSTSKYVIITMK